MDGEPRWPLHYEPFVSVMGRSTSFAPNMNSPIIRLADALYVAAGILGFVAGVTLVLSLWQRVRLARADSVAHPGTVANPDAILIILDGMTRVIGAMAGVFGFLGKLILGALVVLSVMGLSLATALFFTARGLHAQQEWARAVAGVLMLGLFGWSLLSLVALRGWWRLLSLTLGTASGSALWVLWHGYAITT